MQSFETMPSPARSESSRLQARGPLVAVALGVFSLLLLLGCGPKTVAAPEPHGSSPRVGLSLASLPDRARALEEAGAYDAAAILYEEALSQGEAVGIELASVYARLGEQERAIAVLESMQETSDGQLQLNSAARDERLESLRALPRFRELTGFFSLRLINAAGEAALLNCHRIATELTNKGYPHVDLVPTMQPLRLRPSIELKPQFRDRLVELEQVLETPGIEVSELDESSPDDIIVYWGQADALALYGQQLSSPSVEDSEGETAVFDPSTVETVQGRLLVHSSDEGSDVRFPRLREIEGDLVITDRSLRWVEFPALERVSGDIEVRDAENLSELSLPLLHELGGRFELDRCPKLEKLSLARLLRAGDMILVSDNELLKSVYLDRLESADRIVFARNPRLQVLELGELQHLAAQLNLLSNTALHTLNLSRLSQAGSVLFAANDALSTLRLEALTESQGLQLEDNVGLESAAFPTLVSVRGDVVVLGNKRLESIELGKLSSVHGELLFVDNTALTRVDMGELDSVRKGISIALNDALERFVASRLVSIGGQLTVSDNLALQDISLGNLQQVDGVLTIDNNAALPPVLLDAIQRKLKD
ncbi:MAG: hypothetical protein RBU37_14925 [Myxococcota bacterium]|nr:hypothetical protein [Myxococcota bacterium]